MTVVSSQPDLTDRQLYEAVHERMRALAGPGATDLEDLIQIAASQVFRNISRYDGSCQLTTWIYSVCYRVLLGQRRWYRRWSLRFTYLRDEDPPDDLPNPPELLEARARSRQLHRALARLSEKYRTVVVLRDLEELEIREIALIVRANERTVRSRLRDGRKKLQKELRAEFSEQPIGTPHELNPS